MTYSRQIRSIIAAYLAAHATDVYESHAVAAWAIKHKLWIEHPQAIVTRCAAAISRSLGQEMLTEKVRAMHAVRVTRNGVQLTLWADMRKASREHMRLAFTQRRQQIAADCTQLRLDLNYYNENFNSGPPIQMTFTF